MVCVRVYVVASLELSYSGLQKRMFVRLDKKGITPCADLISLFEAQLLV